MLYLRKIDIDAWSDKPADDSDSLSDLSTKNHELSVWEIEDMSELPSIALAVAMTLDKPIPFTAVLLNLEDIKNNFGWDVETRSNLGDTMYTAKKNKHKDFILINANHMIKLASYIHNIIEDRDTTRIFTYNEMELLDLLKKKFEQNEITEADFVDAKGGGGKWSKIHRKYIKGRD